MTTDIDLVCWDFGDTLVHERFMRICPPDVPEWEAIFDRYFVEHPDFADRSNLGQVTMNEMIPWLAAETGMSHAAVSRHIQKLEDRLGYALFVRDNRSVALTPEGETFHRYATDVLDRFEVLRHELGQQAETLSGTLTLFASVTAAQSILPNVLPRFRQAFPDIHIQLETGYAVNALRRLYEGSDVVVAALDDNEDEQLIKRIITSIPILTVAPLDESFSTGGDSIDWQHVPLVLPTAGQTRENVDAWLAEHNIRPNIYAEVPGNEAILSLVALGCGVGFVPELVINDSPLASRVRVLRGGPVLSDFRVGFCTRRSSLDGSPIVRAFWDSI